MAEETAGKTGVLTAGATAKAARVAGRVIHKSDVWTIPDSPYSQGRVWAIPMGRMAGLLKEAIWKADEAVPEGRPMQHLRFRVSREILRRHASGMASVGEGGGYALRLPAGSYALCVSDLSERKGPLPASAEVAVSGCVQAEIRANEKRTFDIYFGEGGVTL